MVDFSTGQTVSFEQTLGKPSDEEIQLQYLLDDLPAEGGYAPALTANLPEAPESWCVLDVENRPWEFKGNFDRVEKAIEVSWRAAGADVVLGLDPACAVETRWMGKEVQLRILPTLGSKSARITLTFRKASRAKETDLTAVLEEARKRTEEGLPGRALVLLRGLLKKYPDATDGKRDLDRLEAQGRTARDDLTARGESLKRRAGTLEKEALGAEIDKCIAECQALERAWEGTDFADAAGTLRAWALEQKNRGAQESVAGEAKAYLDGARANIDRNPLSARIFLESLKSRGLLDLLSPDLRKQYDDLCRQLAPEPAPDPQKMFEEATEMRKLGEAGKEKSLDIYRRIVALFLTHPENEELYSETALKAYKEILAAAKAK